MKRANVSEHREVLGKEGAANVNAALEELKGRGRDILKVRPYGSGCEGPDRRRRGEVPYDGEWDGSWDNAVMALEENR